MIRWLLSLVFGRESVYPEAAAQSVAASLREQQRATELPAFWSRIA